jgi:proton-dependent oligopeptide transporter, POT family
MLDFARRQPDGVRPMTTTDEKAADGSPRGQPKGLPMLFFAEMWERFSFYGMRGLLTLYLTKSLFDHIEPERARDELAYGIYAAYGALVYATPFFGGMLADRLLGNKRAVLLGGVLMAIGHAVMAIENEIALYIALAFLIAGNGFFKPNISTMVGGMYGDNDPRRDAGFTIFYMGINLGAFLQLVPGFLGEEVGWWAGFGLAGIGMMIGLAVFWRFKGVLGTNGDPPSLERLHRKIAGPLSLEWLVYIGAFAAVGLFAFMVWNHALMGFVIVPLVIAGFLVVFVYAVRSEKAVRERLFVVLILTGFNILFWAFFEQAGSSISLFTDRHVDRQVFGWHIPASVFQSVNPFYIFILALPVSALWTALARRKMDPSLGVKFALGLAQLGLGFLVMAWAVGWAFPGVRPADEGDAMVGAALTPLVFLMMGYLLHTTGELCLSPIGLSMVTKLSPKAITSMVMGLWFLSTSVSHHFGGVIAKAMTPAISKETMPGWLATQAGVLARGADHAPEVLSAFDKLASFVAAFKPIGYTALGAAALLLLLSPILKKWQHGVT